MAKPGGARLEIWGLVALFGLFLVSSVYFEQVGQETGALEEPSSLAAQPVGVKALYELYQQLDYRVERLKQPWSHLTLDQKLVLIIEPQSRPPAIGEIPALKKWVESGGTALFIVSKRPAPEPKEEDKEKPDEPNPDTLTGDVDLVNANAITRSVPPRSTDSPYTHEVKSLSVSSDVRLKLAANSPYDPLFKDAEGFIAVHKKLGKGHVLVVANDNLAGNATIQQEDNAIFLNNIALTAVGATHGQIVFDEYHHGVGFSHQAADKNAGLFASMPIPLRLGLWHLLGFGALLFYNGNRFFGTPRRVAQSQYRLRADFVHSMGLLLRRAGASDIALLTLYHSFIRDLRRHFDIAPDAPVENIITQAMRSKSPNAEELHRTLYRCEEIAAGARIHEAEMLSLTRKIDQFRKEFDLVGH